MFYILALLVLFSLGSESWKCRAWNARHIKAFAAQAMIAVSLTTSSSTNAFAASCVDGCYTECMKVAPGEGSKEYCKTTCIEDCSSSDGTTASSSSTVTTQEDSSSQRTSRGTNDIRDGAPSVFDWVPEQMLKNYVDSQKKYGATP